MEPSSEHADDPLFCDLMIGMDPRDHYLPRHDDDDQEEQELKQQRSQSMTVKYSNKENHLPPSLNHQEQECYYPSGCGDRLFHDACQYHYHDHPPRGQKTKMAKGGGGVNTEIAASSRPNKRQKLDMEALPSPTGVIPTQDTALGHILGDFMLDEEGWPSSSKQQQQQKHGGNDLLEAAFLYDDPLYYLAL
jgi:hypothetical protein